MKTVREYLMVVFAAGCTSIFVIFTYEFKRPSGVGQWVQGFIAGAVGCGLFAGIIGLVRLNNSRKGDR